MPASATQRAPVPAPSVIVPEKNRPVGLESVLAVGEDANDPMRDDPVVFVVEQQRRKINFTCNVCKPSAGYEISELPCVRACPTAALTHSW